MNPPESGAPAYGRYMAAELEVQYNNRAAVPEHPAIVAGWAERSATLRARLACRLDLRYGPGDRETLDLFPAAHDGAPLHVFIHGGYWQALDKGYFSFVAEGLARAGVAVAILGYPLCPAVGLADIVASVRRACAWLEANAAALRFDGGRIHLSGHSAGGHLGAMVFARGGPGPAAPAGVRSALAASGLFELEPLTHTSINERLGLDTETAARLSPAALEPSGPAPLTLAVGALESDEFHRQAEAFARRRRAQGAPVNVLTVPDTNHFTVLEALVEPDGALLAAALELIESG